MWFLTGVFIFVGFITFQSQVVQHESVGQGLLSRVGDVMLVVIAFFFFFFFFILVISLKRSRWFKKKKKPRQKPCFHCFQCGKKYGQKKKVEALSQRLSVKDDQFNQLNMENQALSEDLGNVSSKLSEVQLQLQKQQQQHEFEEEKVLKSFQQVELLSQSFGVKDDQLTEITENNNTLKEDRKNILSKYSEVQLQLEKQRQRHEEEQQKNVESCQQVELLSQELQVKDNEYNEMTLVLNILVEHGTHLESKCSAAEQQLQEQREKQEQQNVEHLNQVTLLKKDLQDKEKCWEAMVEKNNNCIKAIYELHRRLQELEQQQQQPQHEPRSQLPLTHEKKQKEQFYQENQRWCHRQQNKGPRVIHHVTSDFELKTSINAWRPAKKTDLTGRDQDVVRQFRSLLNKITPENFNRLIDKIELINIAKEDHLKDVVQLVLDKAILESKFSEVYANMCHHLAKIEVKETGRSDNILTFHALLIQSCENEMKKVIGESSRLDDDESKDKARRRAVGNVVFIGELFNAKVLDESLICTAIKGLLDDASELSLECFCRLLVVTGKILDSTQVTKMNGYFTSLDEVMKERKMPSRIRFMVQDLKDLRMQNWIPRQKVERPQQLQNIREEASAEQHP